MKTLAISKMSIVHINCPSNILHILINLMMLKNAIIVFPFQSARLVHYRGQQDYLYQGTFAKVTQKQVVLVILVAVSQLT